MTDLAGKRALVTGAARGIGYGIARELARRGAAVILADRIAGLADSAATRIRAEGGDAISAFVDLQDADAVDAVFMNVTSLDIVVNNAGTTQYGTLLDTEPAYLREIIENNLMITFIAARAAARTMLARGRGGRIINMASAAGDRVVTRLLGYSVAKAAIVMLTKQMAVELADKGITVNAVAPGPIMTEMLKQNQNNTIQEALAAPIPMGHFGTPEDVAGAVAYLASDAARFVTGHVLTIDGGLTITAAMLHRVIADERDA